VVLIGVGCAVSGSFVTLLLTVLGAAGATARAAAGELLPSIGGDLLLALIVTPVVRWFLRSQALRVPAAGHG
jgi:Zn-dependent protease with chaperone function